MSEYLIETKRLCKKYNDEYALKDASITIEKGKIYGLVGENGAGKTTLIKLLAGLIKPSSGNIIFQGDDSDAGLRKHRKQFGFIVEAPYLNPEMSAFENLNLQRIQRGIKDKNRIEKVLNIVGLENSKKKVENYSLGMKQRLGIAIALLEKIDVLVLDEPTNGLDPAGIIEFRKLIVELNEKLGITIIISSHILSELECIATDLIFVSKSNIVKSISMDEVKKCCERKYILNVSDCEKVKYELENNGIKVEVNDEQKLIIYGEISAEEIAYSVFKKGCYTYEFREEQQTLEQYYLSLVGGNNE